MSHPATGDLRLTAIVRGYVQGVGYRFFVQRHASALGLRGYVRNRPDGTVEVVAEGPRADLERLLVDLERGPYGAEIADVDATWSPAAGTFSGFQIRH